MDNRINLPGRFAGIGASVAGPSLPCIACSLEMVPFTC